MNYKRSLYAAAMLAAAFAVPGPGVSQTAPAPFIALPPPQAAPAISEGVAVIVNDDLISTLDVRERVKWLIMTTGVEVTPQTLPQVQQKAREELIYERLKLQELKRRQAAAGLTDADMFVPDKDVDDFLTQLAKQNNSTLTEFLREVAKNGVSTTKLRTQYKINMSWEKFFQDMYGRKVRIGPNQVKQLQDQMSAAAATPQYLLGEIFLAADRAGSVQAAVAQGNQILAQIQTQGARFENLALQYSGKPTAATGGDAGWVNANDLPPAIAEALSQVRAGQITRPIPVQDGAYIYLVRDKSAGGGTSIVTLKQAAVSLDAGASAELAANAQRQLLALKAKGPTCTTLESMAAGLTGVEVGDLGETEVTDLSATFRAAVESLPIDQVSDPVRTDRGLHLIAVCGRRAAGVAAPKATDIENQLYSEQMEMRERVVLRNLQASATISTP